MEKKRVIYRFYHPKLFVVMWVISSKAVDIRFWYIIMQFYQKLRQHDILIFVIVSFYDGLIFLFITRNFLRGENFVRGDKFLGVDDTFGNLLLLGCRIFE